ncbi:hypothetical protein [Azotobacter armeniacus]
MSRQRRSSVTWLFSLPFFLIDDGCILLKGALLAQKWKSLLFHIHYPVISEPSQNNRLTLGGDPVRIAIRTYAEVWPSGLRQRS